MTEAVICRNMDWISRWISSSVLGVGIVAEALVGGEGLVFRGCTRDECRGGKGKRLRWDDVFLLSGLLS